jgi:hypothetical protein
LDGEPTASLESGNLAYRDPLVNEIVARAMETAARDGRDAFSVRFEVGGPVVD